MFMRACIPSLDKFLEHLLCAERTHDGEKKQQTYSRGGEKVDLHPSGYLTHRASLREMPASSSGRCHRASTAGPVRLGVPAPSTRKAPGRNPPIQQTTRRNSTVFGNASTERHDTKVGDLNDGKYVAVPSPP